MEKNISVMNDLHKINISNVLNPPPQMESNLVQDIPQPPPSPSPAVSKQLSEAIQRRVSDFRLSRRDLAVRIAESTATTQNIPLPAQKSTSPVEGIDWGSVTFGQLCRIGWGVFFPFIVSVILAALLIGAAVIAAFNGSIRW